MVCDSQASITSMNNCIARTHTGEKCNRYTSERFCEQHGGTSLPLDIPASVIEGNLYFKFTFRAEVPISVEMCDSARISELLHTIVEYADFNETEAAGYTEEELGLVHMYRHGVAHVKGTKLTVYVPLAQGAPQLSPVQLEGLGIGLNAFHYHDIGRAAGSFVVGGITGDTHVLYLDTVEQMYTTRVPPECRYSNSGQSGWTPPFVEAA